MPYVRISLRAGKPPAHLEAISRSVLRAMSETFEVPPEDCFQIFHQLAPNELVVHPTYMGGPRSADFVHIAMTTGRQRPKETKRALYRRTVELLAADPGLRPEDVMIVLTNSEPDDWSFGGGRMWEPNHTTA